MKNFRDLNIIFGGSHGVQWFFAVISILGAIYAYIFLPETHGQKLSDIQKYFLHNTVYLGQSKQPKKQATTPKDVETGVTKRLVPQKE